MLLAMRWRETLRSEERALRKGCEDQEAAQLDRTSAVMERGHAKKRHSISKRAEAERAKIQCAVGRRGRQVRDGGEDRSGVNLTVGKP